MILIDTVFINDGGGRILLDYLIKHLNFEKYDFTFLLDSRTEPYELLSTKKAKIYFVHGLRKRNVFYKKNHKNFEKVFCLGNIPPPLKIAGVFINYLHSSYYVSPVDKTQLKHYIVTNLKKFYFNALVKNVDVWVVQTRSMQNNLYRNRKVDLDRIKILPFFDVLNSHDEYRDPEQNLFLYVSDGGPRKNHARLFKAFCKFYDEYKMGELWLTISDTYPDVKKLIYKYRLLGYPIVNKGFVGRHELENIYSNASFVIYPSLTESFGLGLVEACNFKCKILAADLKYVFDVCEPSYSFNPYSDKAIADAFRAAITQNLPKANLLIKNEIKSLLQLIEQDL